MGKYEPAALARSMRVKRAELDISQQELARRMNVNITTITAYEGGTMTPGADKLCELASALECTPNDILCWK